MEDFKLKYEQLKAKVIEVQELQKLYWKSNKDLELLKRSKAAEAQLKEMVNPKPKPAISQAQLDWLGQ